MVNCVLFDLDNTLLLKSPSIPEKLFELASAASPEIKMETVEEAYAASELWQGEQIKKENETGVRMSDEEYFENVMAVYRKFLPLGEELSSRLFSILSRNYDMEYRLMPHTEEVLTELKNRGLPLGIVSNNHVKIRQVLTDLELAKYFSSIIISEEVNLFKPDPEILKLACREIGAPCGDSIYVGDHPFDILCAHSAGMPAAWLPPNRFFRVPEYIGRPEYTLTKLAELPQILE